MLRLAALFLVITIASVLTVFLGKVISIGIVMIAKVALVISFPLFLIFIIIDIIKRKKKGKA